MGRDRDRGLFEEKKFSHEGILASYITIRCLDTDSRDRALGNLEVESVKSSIGQMVRRNEEVDVKWAGGENRLRIVRG
jgi:hypothetical protein